MAAYDNKVLTGEQLGVFAGLVKSADATKQDAITLTNKLDPALVATGNDNLFVTATEKSTWNAKADASAIPDELADLSEDSTHRLVTDAEKTSWNAKADTSDIPTALSELTADATHRLVSDTEKTTWNGKADMSDIPDELADLTDDSTHRLVTDSDKTNWNGKTDLATVQALGYQTNAQVVSTVEGYGYQTAAQVTSAINTAIAGLTGFHFIRVNTLPVSDIDINAIYLKPKASASTDNIYEEWAYVVTDSTTDPVTYGWEHLGDTQLDLDTLTTQEVTTIWNSASAT